MKSQLLRMKCRPCEGISDKLSRKQVKLSVRQLKGWKLVKNKITKTYKFKNFKSALRFVNKIGAIAEKEAHHPDVEFGWGYVIITLQTHALKGLSMNDFIMAAKINEIY